jgi:hypothetical protein
VQEMQIVRSARKRANFLVREPQRQSRDPESLLCSSLPNLRECRPRRRVVFQAVLDEIAVGPANSVGDGRALTGNSRPHEPEWVSQPRPGPQTRYDNVGEHAEGVYVNSHFPISIAHDPGLECLLCEKLR